MRLIASHHFGSSFRKPLLVGLGAIAACAWFYVVYFHGLADRDLWNSHEARAAMDAQTIIDDGEWLVPRLYDGRPELQKPPLYYWMVAGVAKLRGGTVDAQAVRLPSTIAALVAVAFVVMLGWRCGRLREGMLAGVVLATMVHFTWLARVGRIDMPLTGAVTAALVCYYVGQAVPDVKKSQAQPDLRLLHFAWLMTGYVCIAAAMLLKGPIGFVLPAAAIALHLAVEGKLPAPWRVRRWAMLAHRLGLWWGLPLVAVVVGSWFLLANQATDGELWQVFIVHHNVERGLGGSSLRSHPWWFYGPRLIVDCLPWSLLLPLAVVWFVRDGRWKADPLARFGIVWLAAMLLVLSVAGYKRADYLVPAYPGLALFLGCAFTAVRRRDTIREPSAARRGFTGLLAVGIVLLCTACGWWVRVEFALPEVEAQREHRSFAAMVRRHAPSPEPVALFRTEAHALAFHLGRPVQSLVWWEDLDRLRPGEHIVMPVALAEETRERLRNVRLTEMARTIDEHEKPLVLFRVEPVHSMSFDWPR